VNQSYLIAQSGDGGWNIPLATSAKDTRADIPLEKLSHSVTFINSPSSVKTLLLKQCSLRAVSARLPRANPGANSADEDLETAVVEERSGIQSRAVKG
jgi:hypothetical protein